MKERHRPIKSLLLFLSIIFFSVISSCSVTQQTSKSTKVPLPPDNFKMLEKIVDHSIDDLNPEVSPSGRLIAYSSEKGGNFDVFYFDPFQPRITVIQATRHISDDLDPSWSPDGKDLYFTSSRLYTLSIWKISVVRHKRGVRQITAREGWNDFNPHVSPDGMKIVFCSRKGKKSSKFGLSKTMPPTLWVANTDGTRMTQIGSGENPRWSPDGKKILFHALSDKNYDIWTINPDGTELTQLTTDSADDVDACWSPDGRKIVFSSDREGTVEANVKTNFDIWLLDLEGTGITQLTYDPGNDGAPCWSKSGLIYFHSDRDDNYDIFRGEPIIPWEQ
jgi:Tol biopolymer transport system component